jgi:pyruvate, water dikinase
LDPLVRRYRDGRCVGRRRQERVAGRKIGICGQAPSDYPEFAQFLVDQGIDSLSLSPDSLLKTMLAIVDVEKTLAQGGSAAAVSV